MGMSLLGKGRTRHRYLAKETRTLYCDNEIDLSGLGHIIFIKKKKELERESGRVISSQSRIEQISINGSTSYHIFTHMSFHTKAQLPSLVYQARSRLFPDLPGIAPIRQPSTPYPF